MKQQPSTKLSRWVGKSNGRLFLVNFLFALVFLVPLNILINWKTTRHGVTLLIMALSTGIVSSLTSIYMKKQIAKEQARKNMGQEKKL